MKMPAMLSGKNGGNKDRQENRTMALHNAKQDAAKQGASQVASQVEGMVPPEWGLDTLGAGLARTRQALRTAQKTCLVLSLAALVSLCAFLVTLLARPAPVYFGMSTDMKLLPMTPLSEPVLTDAALKNWVAEAVSSSFNLDYLNWREQLTKAREYFTPSAFTSFALSLDREGHLALMRQQKALVHAVVQGAPVLTKSGVLSGVLVREFEVPLLLTYETSMGRIANNAYTVAVRVRRVSPAENARGVAISSLVASRKLQRPDEHQ